MTIREIAEEAATKMLERWSIGECSQFCDDPPDFDYATTEEIVEFLVPYLICASGLPCDDDVTQHCD